MLVAAMPWVEQGERDETVVSAQSEGVSAISLLRNRLYTAQSSSATSRHAEWNTVWDVAKRRLPAYLHE